MVVVKIKDKSLYIDGYLKKNLDFIKKRLQPRNETHICIIGGRIGTGKSTLVDQLAYYCADGNLTLPDKAFTVADFSKILDAAKKGQPNNNIILDEAFELNKRKALSIANYKMLKQLQRIRSKNLFIWIVLPCVYDLDKNIILELCNLFIRCYQKYDFGRKGFFSVYDRHRLKKLWLYCRDTLEYYESVARPNFRGRFTQAFLSSPYDEYEIKKHSKLDEQESVEQAKPIVKRQQEQRDILMYYVTHIQPNPSKAPDVAQAIGFNKDSIYPMITHGRKLYEKLHPSSDLSDSPDTPDSLAEFESDSLEQ